MLLLLGKPVSGIGVGKRGTIKKVELDDYDETKVVSIETLLQTDEDWEMHSCTAYIGAFFRTTSAMERYALYRSFAKTFYLKDWNLVTGLKLMVVEPDWRDYNLATRCDTNGNLNCIFFFTDAINFYDERGPGS